MKVEKVKVVEHREHAGEYRIITVLAPLIASSVRPGQFVHLKVPRLDGAVLRRPFSVFMADRKRLTILYKCVGKGTHAMRSIVNGDELSLMGPMGNGFPMPSKKAFPVFVAGGYGVAPLYFLARRMRRKGIIFMGGAKAGDILCAKDFRRLGWKVVVATEDGSMGTRGLVTRPLDKWLSMELVEEAEFFVCGPDGLLRAVGERAKLFGWKAWLSLDKHMGCGVGACLACVQKIKTADGEEVLARVCREGPVFEAREVVWES